MRPPDNYLRDNMVLTLDEMDVEFEMRVQLQTDPFLMPIENNAVLWPERLSPRVPVATLRIPRQKFDDPEQFAFTRNLKFNPWHCLPEHRPLGNQSRARKRMYDELAMFRQKMNAAEHVEPTADDWFGEGSVAGDPLQRGEPGQEEIGAAADGDELRNLASHAGSWAERRAGKTRRCAAGRRTGVSGNASRLPSKRILLAGERGEFRAGDPGALYEFELARDIGVQTEEVQSRACGRRRRIERRASGSIFSPYSRPRRRMRWKRAEAMASSSDRTNGHTVVLSDQGSVDDVGPGCDERSIPAW